MTLATPRQAALSIVRTLRDAGHVAYFAGGCVRDELLGITPSDYDIATEALPDQVAALFRRTREVGKSFGVMLVPMSGTTIEVSTFRREHGYSDNRRPDAVEFCDAQSDAKRRDFTINALYIDPLDTADDERGRVIDFVAGLDDLRAKVVRAVGDPEERLAEDHLRALRAVRFASRLGFELESKTRAAIREHARDLLGVSRERIGDELRIMLQAPTRIGALALIESLELDAPVLDGTARGGRASERVDSFPCVAALSAERVDFGLALAAWAVDRLGHRAAGVAIAAQAGATASQWRAAMCLSNDETDLMRATMSGVGLIEAAWADLSVARRKRAAASAWFPGALAIVRGRLPQVADAVSHKVGALAADGIGLAPKPFITGDDLIAAGLSPGPKFGKWLGDAYDRQLEGRLATQPDAIALVLSWAGQSG